MIEFIFKQCLFLYFAKKVCLETIPHLLQFQRITMCRFTTQFIKNYWNYNFQGFKELKYEDLQLDLQRITT